MRHKSTEHEVRIDARRRAPGRPLTATGEGRPFLKGSKGTVCPIFHLFESFFNLITHFDCLCKGSITKPNELISSSS